jgi:hypothetical protein
MELLISSCTPSYALSGRGSLMEKVFFGSQALASSSISSHWCNRRGLMAALIINNMSPDTDKLRQRFNYVENTS